jgi:GNAT superfamily N-acetyltransferase
MAVRLATTDDDILACYPVIAQLRPHVERHEFIERVHDQQKEGYQLAFIEEDGRVVAAAGFRINRSLAWGKFLYVDDLVTAGLDRSKGHGQALMDWLLETARQGRCDSFHLDSGVQRHAAHRFYMRNRMAISSLHFSIDLKD